MNNEPEKYSMTSDQNIIKDGESDIKILPELSGVWV
jgi:hypothetical protein